MTDGVQRLLVSIIEAHSSLPSKWRGAPFFGIKHVANTKVGQVGQEFVETLCGICDFETEVPRKPDGTRTPTSPWDIKIAGVAYEIKTASEDVSGSFQFNHIRLHRPYDAVLCLGIGPGDVLFNAWSKADIATSKAGHLVTMDKGSSATFKLTKRRDALRPIDEFEDCILELTSDLLS